MKAVAMKLAALGICADPVSRPIMLSCANALIVFRIAVSVMILSARSSVSWQFAKVIVAHKQQVNNSFIRVKI